MSDGDYDNARQELLGLGKAVKFACFAGGLKLPEPESNGKKAEPGKTGQIEGATCATKVAKQHHNHRPREVYNKIPETSCNHHQ